MSTIIVAHARLRRFLVPVSFSVCAVLVAMLATIQLRQQWKRHQAEKLLAEISDLELRSATYDDAQKIAREWHRYAKTSPGCSSSRCEITIALADWGAYPSWLFNPPWLARLVLRSGVRPARMEAAIGVRDGVVWSKHFGVEMVVRNLRYPNPLPLTLMADASTVSHFRAFFRDDPQLELHRDYIIGRPGGCEGPCVLAYAKVTPYADPADTKRLMQIDLSCLTRWTPCQDEADILPQPWAQHEKEASAIWQAADPHPCGGLNAELLARDSAYASIVQVTDVNKSPDGNSYRKVRARMVRALKPLGSWSVGAEAEFTIDQRSLFSPELQLQKGSEVILLFGMWPEIEVAQCGVLPVTDSSLQQVMSGVEEDFAPDSH